MPVNLRNRSLLTLRDVSPEEIRFLLTLASDLKAAKRAGLEQPRLVGKNIALIFERASTRTRAGFEVAAHDQGAQVTYLGPGGSQLGHKETMKDTARVLGRMYDGIQYRGYRQSACEELAAHAGVPVWNGLTDEYHPTQVLADLLTMQEHRPGRRPSEIAFCFVGDTRSNMANSLLVGGVKSGMDVRLCGPRPLWPAEELQAYCRGVAAETGARTTLTESVAEGVGGVDFVHADRWLWEEQTEAEWGERLALLAPYRVDDALMAATGNPAARFMHCLPAFHNTDTAIGRRVKERFGHDEVEVTDAVFESPASIVFDQAENRMHTIKALLVATIGS